MSGQPCGIASMVLTTPLACPWSARFSGTGPRALQAKAPTGWICSSNGKRPTSYRGLHRLGPGRGHGPGPTGLRPAGCRLCYSPSSIRGHRAGAPRRARRPDYRRGDAGPAAAHDRLRRHHSSGCVGADRRCTKERGADAIKSSLGFHAQFIEALPPGVYPPLALKLLQTVVEAAKGTQTGLIQL
jgi:hypothetical protein